MGSMANFQVAAAICAKTMSNKHRNVDSFNDLWQCLPKQHVINLNCDNKLIKAIMYTKICDICGKNMK